MALGLPSGLICQEVNRVFRDLRIDRNQREAFHLRLSYQDSIERIAVMIGKSGESQRVRHRNRQFFEAVVRDSRGKIDPRRRRQWYFPERVFNDNFPRRGA